MAFRFRGEHQIPTRIVVVGDQAYARTLIPLGKRVLRKLDDDMDFQSLPSGKSSIRLNDGTIITAISQYGLSTVYIEVQPVKEKEEKGRVEEEIVHYFVWIKNTTSNHEDFKTNRLILWELPLAKKGYTNTKGIEVKAGGYDAEAGSIILEVDIEQEIVYTPDCGGVAEKEAVQIALARKYLDKQMEPKNLPENLFSGCYNMGTMTSPDDTYIRYHNIADRPDTVTIYEFNNDDCIGTVGAADFTLGLSQAFEDVDNPGKPKFTFMMEPYQNYRWTMACDKGYVYELRTLAPQQQINLSAPFVYLPYGGTHNDTPLVYTCEAQYKAAYSARWVGYPYEVIENNVWPEWDENSVKYYGNFGQQIREPSRCLEPFASAGGELLFWGNPPTLNMDAEGNPLAVRTFQTGEFFTGTEGTPFPTFVVGLSGYVVKETFRIITGVHSGYYFDLPGHPLDGCEDVWGTEGVPHATGTFENGNVFNGADQSILTPFETIGLDDLIITQGASGAIQTGTCFDVADSATLFFSTAPDAPQLEERVFSFIPCTYPFDFYGTARKISNKYDPDVFSVHPQYVEDSRCKFMSLPILFERGVAVQQCVYWGENGRRGWGDWPMSFNDYWRICYEDGNGNPGEGEGWASSILSVPYVSGSFVGVVFYVLSPDNFYETDDEKQKINFFDPHTEHVKELYGNEGHISPHRLLDLEEHVLEILHDRKERTYDFPEEERYRGAVYNLYRYGDEFKTGFVSAL